MTVSDEDSKIFEVLGLKYSALRNDILHRSAARYSLLGVLLGVAAVLVALVDNSEKIHGGIVILWVYVVTVAATYFDAGRAIARLSDRSSSLRTLSTRRWVVPVILCWCGKEGSRRIGNILAAS